MTLFSLVHLALYIQGKYIWVNREHRYIQPAAHTVRREVVRMPIRFNRIGLEPYEYCRQATRGFRGVVGSVGSAQITSN